MGSLRSEIAKLEGGSALTTTATRAGISLAAKRAGVKVKVTKEGDVLKVTRIGEATGLEAAIGTIKDLRPRERLRVFERFELCCGMNRGSCVCVSEKPDTVIPDNDRQDDRQATLANIRSLMTAGADRIGDHHLDDWRFTSDPPQYADNGNIYRRQALHPLCKRSRTVRVALGDLDQVIDP